MSDSFQSVPVRLNRGQKEETAQRTINSPKIAINRPAQVAVDIFGPGAEDGFSSFQGKIP